MEFEWDPKKDARNFAKHGYTFQEAKAVFADPNVVFELDGAEVEERWRAIGLSADRILFVVFVERGFDRVRIISARRAERHEKDRYFRQALPQR